MPMDGVESLIDYMKNLKWKINRRHKRDNENYKVLTINNISEKGLELLPRITLSQIISMTRTQ